MAETKPLRIAFMGTPDFAVVALKALHDAGHHIVAVYCQPPKPAGRGHQIQKTPMHRAAETLGIPIHTPKTLRNAEEQELFRALNLDVAIVAAYGLILPQAILDTPKRGCINIHGSLLPRWRGAAPLQRAILAGDNETGITIMQMDAGLDTGAMLLKDSTPITSETNTQSLHDELAAMAGRLIVRALNNIDKLTPTPQPDSGATYAAKLTRENGKIDWTKSASEIERQMRALNPWPGCFFTLNGENIKLLAAEIVPDKSGAAGTLLAEDFTVACGEQSLRLVTVQRASKNATDGTSLLHGLRLAVGASL